MSRESRVNRSPKVLSRRLDNELALYDTEQGQVHFLNPTAATVWELCDGSRIEQEIVSEMIERYDAPAENIEEDVRRILREFREKNLTR